MLYVGTVITNQVLGNRETKETEYSLILKIERRIRNPILVWTSSFTFAQLVVSVVR